MVIAVSLNIYQTSKTVHVHALTLQTHQRCTAQGVCSHGSVLLSHSENIVTRIGLQQQPIRFLMNNSGFKCPNSFWESQTQVLILNSE